MEKMRGRKRTGKLFTLALIVSLAVTFTPVFGESADPVTDQGPEPNVAEVAVPENGEKVDVTEGENTAEDISDATENVPEAESNDVVEEATTTPDAKARKGSGKSVAGVDEREDANKELANLIKGYASQYKQILQGKVQANTINIYDEWAYSYQGKNLVLKVRINKNYKNRDKIVGVIFDGDVLRNYYNEDRDAINETIDMSAYSTGYHTVVVMIQNKQTGQADAEQTRYVEKIYINNITSKPNYKPKYETYWNKLILAPYDIGYGNMDGSLYLEYSGNGGKTWARSGYLEKNWITLAINQKYQITKLRPNTNYRTRIRYGTYVTYERDVDKLKLGDGKSYFFGGPVLYTGTYKTGKGTKPAVKKIKVNVTKVKYHKVKHYGYYTGVYLYTEKFYTYKIKVTVTLKKKPGTKGIWLNGRWLKGNKKKYTTVFSPYPNYATKKPPKGFSKYTVSLSSGQAKGYGGYSPTFKKSYKVKKH